MGNRTSRHEDEEEKEDTTRSAARPTMLSEQVAWAIATAWHAQLRETFWPGAETTPWHCDYDLRTQATRPHDARFAIDQHIAYVDFSFAHLDGARRDDAQRAARSAALAWFALSCCRGFSGLENPQFWWRVLSTRRAPSRAYAASPLHAWATTHVIDSHAFFPDAKRPFPRIRVRAFEHELFFDQADRVDEKLTAALAQLEPFLCATRWQRELCVAVCVNKDAAASLIRSISNRNQHEQPRARTRKQLRFAEVQYLQDRENECMDPTMLTATCDAPFGTDASPLVRRRLQTVHLCDLNAGSSAADVVAACCSALPHTRAVTSVRIDGRDANDLLAAWLGYAIFHPDHRTSYMDLTVQWQACHRSAIRRLAAMAQGNNLLATMGVTTTTNYHQAKLRAGTPVRLEPIEASTSLFTCPSDLWLTACVPNATSLNPTDAFVRVVLPGRGIGFVHTKDILEIVERPPGKSRVRRLQLHVPEDTSDTDGTIAKKDFVEDVLAVLGRGLAFLDLVTRHTRRVSSVTLASLHLGTLHNQELSCETLQCVLKQCPNLTSLRVRHDGSIWSTDPSERAVLLPARPRLKKLELVIYDRLQPLTAPQLSRLEVFQVSNATPGCFAANRDSVLAVLQLCPALQRVVWRSDRVAMDLDAQQRTAARLLGHVITRGVHDIADVPLSVAARVAFLSATIGQDLDALHRLSQEVMGHIFSFCSHWAPRQFHINDGPSN